MIMSRLSVSILLALPSSESKRHGRLDGTTMLFWHSCGGLSRCRHTSTTWRQHQNESIRCWHHGYLVALSLSQFQIFDNYQLNMFAPGPLLRLCAYFSLLCRWNRYFDSHDGLLGLSIWVSCLFVRNKKAG